MKQKCCYWNPIWDSSTRHQGLIALLHALVSVLFFITRSQQCYQHLRPWNARSNTVLAPWCLLGLYRASLGSPPGLIVMAHQMCPCLCTFYQVLIFFSKVVWGFKRPAPSKGGPLQSCVHIHANGIREPSYFLITCQVGVILDEWHAKYMMHGIWHDDNRNTWGQTCTCCCQVILVIELHR